ncbi:hypothetical protein ACQ0MK_10725 [Thalassospira lucentensis]|uniref:hypothetical protein n=1 Tax=Thalassospira lucentensis TaxID=168935 RepID=UPI003D2F378D
MRRSCAAAYQAASFTGTIWFHALDEFGEPIRDKRKVNEEQATIIREIFEYHAEGRKLEHTCDDLNR